MRRIFVFYSDCENKTKILEKILEKIWEKKESYNLSSNDLVQKLGNFKPAFHILFAVGFEPTNDGQLQLVYKWYTNELSSELDHTFRRKCLYLNDSDKYAIKQWNEICKDEQIQRCSSHNTVHQITNMNTEIDFSIFNNSWFTHCKSNNDSFECMATMRIINALKHCLVLNLEDDGDKEKLIEFVHNIYTSMLNDYIHIVNEHDNTYHMNEIFNLLIQNVKGCNIMDCEPSIRHSRNREDDHETESFYDEDTEFLFYRELLDLIHSHLYHLQDIGLRVNVKDLQNEMDHEAKKDEDEMTKWLDPKFKVIKKMIQEKIQRLKEIDGFNMERFDSNKFNVGLIKDIDGNGM